MKQILTASLIALSALMAPAASFAAALPSPDVEAMGSTVGSQAPSLRAVDGGIELAADNESGQVFMIYSITGQLVRKVSVDASAHETVELPGGCYVVRCQAWAKKIVVR